MNVNNYINHKSVSRFYKFSIDTSYAKIEDVHDAQDFLNRGSLYLEKKKMKKLTVTNRPTFDQEFESQK